MHWMNDNTKKSLRALLEHLEDRNVYDCMTPHLDELWKWIAVTSLTDKARRELIELNKDRLLRYYHD